MPKAEPHFDSIALLSAVQQQDIGLMVDTNNPRGFIETLYKFMRARLDLRCHIYQAPGSKQRFYLCKAPAPSADELTLGEASG